MSEETVLPVKTRKAKDPQTSMLLDKWKNRRRMAWVSLYSIIVVTIMAFYCVPIEKLKVLESVITWFYTIQGGIVGSYIGLATFSEKWEKNPPKK